MPIENQNKYPIRRNRKEEACNKRVNTSVKFDEQKKCKC